MEAIKLHQFIEKLTLKGYSERTIEEYTSRIKQFFLYLEEQETIRLTDDIRAEHIKAYHAHIKFEQIGDGRYLSQESVVARLTVLKTFFRLMKEENLIPCDLSEYVVLPKVRRNIPRHVPSQKDMVQLLKSAKPVGVRGIRDRRCPGQV